MEVTVTKTVCGICRRQARDLKRVKASIESDFGELQYDDDTCRRCHGRVVHFLARGIKAPGNAENPQADTLDTPGPAR